MQPFSRQTYVRHETIYISCGRIFAVTINLTVLQIMLLRMLISATSRMRSRDHMATMPTYVALPLCSEASSLKKTKYSLFGALCKIGQTEQQREGRTNLYTCAILYGDFYKNYHITHLCGVGGGSPHWCLNIVSSNYYATWLKRVRELENDEWWRTEEMALCAYSRHRTICNGKDRQRSSSVTLIAAHQSDSRWASARERLRVFVFKIGEAGYSSGHAQ